MALHDVKVAYKPGGLGRLKEALRNVDKEPALRSALNQWSSYYRAFLRERFITFSRGGGDWEPLAESTLRRRLGPAGKARKGQGTGKRKAARPTAAQKPGRPRKPRKGRSRTLSAAALARQLAREQRAFQARAARAAKQGAARKTKKARLGAAILRDTNAMFAAFQPFITKVTGITTARARLSLVVRFTTKYGLHKTAQIMLDDLMEIHHEGKGDNLPARELIVGPNPATASRMADRMEKAFQVVLNKRAS